MTLGAIGGTFDIAPSTTLAIDNVITGSGGLTKSGAGTLALTGIETYTGVTSNTAGTLMINGTVGGSSVIAAGGTLAGNGIITAPVLVQPGATLSPGSSIGVLSISNSLALSGATFIELNKVLMTNDLVQGVTSVTYGGTLSLTNLDGTLAAGDSFKVFDATSYNGTFTNIVPAAPGQWLAWDLSKLTVDGTVRVSGVAVNRI